MERVTEQTRSGGTHHVKPRKAPKRDDREATDETEEQSDADEAGRHRGEG